MVSFTFSFPLSMKSFDSLFTSPNVLTIAVRKFPSTEVILPTRSSPFLDRCVRVSDPFSGANNIPKAAPAAAPATMPNIIFFCAHVFYFFKIVRKIDLMNQEMMAIY